MLILPSARRVLADDFDREIAVLKVGKFDWSVDGRVGAPHSTVYAISIVRNPGPADLECGGSSRSVGRRLTCNRRAGGDPCPQVDSIKTGTDRRGTGRKTKIAADRVGQPGIGVRVWSRI